MVAIESAWDATADTIDTFVTLDVVRGCGLPGAAPRVVVKQLGGVVNNTAFVVGGQARFTVGEECLVFLDVRPRDETLSVAGLENDATVTITWRAPAEGQARLGNVLYAGTAPGLANVGMATTTGTGITVPNVPDGIDYVRVVSVGAGGHSAPTADLVINVRVTAPTAPINVIGSTAAGGNVLATWQPAAQGDAPAGYRVLVGHAPGATNYVFDVTTPSIGGTAIPAATYYMRIVAVNSAGMSAPSTEVMLVVR